MPVTDNHSGETFDEQRALQELERLQQAIAETRRKRQQTTAEFEHFLRGFRPAAAPAAPADSAPARTPTIAPPERAHIPARVPELPPPSPHVHVRAAPFEPEIPAGVTPSSRKASVVAGLTTRTFLMIGAAVLVLGAGALVVRSWRSAPQNVTLESRQPAPAPDRGSVAAPSAPAAQPPPVVPSATPSGTPAPTAARPTNLQAELTTVRRVWVRVLVDGTRTVETELPAGAHVPLRAEQTLVIRTGDAGAVRLTLNGREPAPLGPDGQVVTRTFTAPAGARR